MTRVMKRLPRRARSAQLRWFNSYTPDFGQVIALPERPHICPVCERRAA